MGFRRHYRIQTPLPGAYADLCGCGCGRAGAQGGDFGRRCAVPQRDARRCRSLTDPPLPPLPLPPNLCHPAGPRSCPRRAGTGPRAHLGGRLGAGAGAGSGARRGPGLFGSVRQRLPAARRGLGALFTERVGSASPESLLGVFFFFFFFCFLGKRVFLQPGRGHTRHRGGQHPGAGSRPGGPSRCP